MTNTMGKCLTCGGYLFLARVDGERTYDGQSVPEGACRDHVAKTGLVASEPFLWRREVLLRGDGETLEIPLYVTHEGGVIIDWACEPEGCLLYFVIEDGRRLRLRHTVATHHRQRNLWAGDGHCEVVERVVLGVKQAVTLHVETLVGDVPGHETLALAGIAHHPV